MSSRFLPEKFRKLELHERQQQLRQTYSPDPEEWSAVSDGGDLDELSRVMVESSIGSLPVPLGIAAGFLIDGRRVDIPMAVEEPSVIAAAGFAAKILRQGGGLHTWATEPVMIAQVFLENAPAEAEQRLRREQQRIGKLVDQAQPGMKKRGGGFRGLELTRLEESGILAVDVRFDVRDAMGANALNTAAEAIRPELERLSRGRAVMCILSNASRERRAGARFSLPVSKLAALAREGITGDEVARRIALASEIADQNEQRAITHNKGIMNGISALVLATMNDTRAVEAGAHAWAAHSGRYRPLSRFRLLDPGAAPGAAPASGLSSAPGETDATGTSTASVSTKPEQILEGEIELPLAVGSVGGAVGFHPAGRLAMRVLGFPDARTLSRIAAALGLAQNFAAVLALVTGGIQRGHMKLHAGRLAFLAGARGEEVRRVAEAVAASVTASAAGVERFNLKQAEDALRRLREEQLS